MERVVLPVLAVAAAGLLVAMGVWLVLGSAGAPSYAAPIFFTAFLSFLTPVAIIGIRHQVRRIRVKLIELFAENFRLLDDSKREKERDVSFEFVRGKYFADLDLDLPPHQDPTAADIPRYPFATRSDWMLLLWAVPYMMLTGFGIFLLFSPVAGLGQGGGLRLWLPPSLLSAGGAPDGGEAAGEHVRVLTVAALTYAGAYFYTIRLFLRAVAVFDLSPLTFLRAFAHVIMSVTLSIVIYRVASGLPELWPGSAGAADGGAADLGVGGPWLFVAFALGFVPDSALNYLLQKSGVAFKGRDGDLDTHSRTIPLTIIDGIDHYISFRLEEANAHDIQNLAAANPIMLHIETPFGIYALIDWIAQAQLCTAVGPERFLLLRTLGIRTLFDLEEAVRSEAGDAALEEAVQAALLRGTLREQRMRDAFGLGEAVTPEGGGTAGQTVRSMVGLMMRNLHVVRLRQVRLKIRERLDEEEAPPAGVPRQPWGIHGLPGPEDGGDPAPRDPEGHPGPVGPNGRPPA